MSSVDVAPDQLGLDCAVQVAGVVRSYGDVVAVDHVSFEVRRGEVFGLLGRNGAGKSTTIEMVCGLAEPAEGEIRIFGSTHGAPGRKAYAHVGYAPQPVSVYPLLTVNDNVELVARLRGLGKRRSAAVDSALRRLELDAFRDRRCGELSGGEQRRVVLAMAMVHEPSVLVLDEPTANVDVGTRHVILDLVRELSERGVAILYTTHYLEEAESLCDRAAIMHRGRIVTEGTVAGLIAAHGSGAIEIRTEATFDEAALDDLRRVPGTDELQQLEGAVRLVGRDPQGILIPALEVMQRHGLVVGGIATTQPRLEGVFLQITGELIDEQP